MGYSSDLTTRLAVGHLATLANSLIDNSRAPNSRKNPLFRSSKVPKLLLTYATQPTSSEPTAADTICSGPLPDYSIYIHEDVPLCSPAPSHF